MNRLSTLIVRRVGLLAPPLPTAAGCWGEVVEDDKVSLIPEDLRFFLTTWAAGFVFFGTLLG